MSKKYYFDDQFGLDVCAVTQDGRLNEYLAEPASQGAVIGNIYKGRVAKVLNGMQAAFVDCGLERHCYVSVADLTEDRRKYDGEELDIPVALNLREGDEIMVQITKAPIGNKGAKASTNLSFVGKYLIYLPNSSFIGVSRKIGDEELRGNMIFAAKRELKEGEGAIMRTAAPFAVKGVKVDEANYYRKVYAGVKEKFAAARVGDLIYSDSRLYVRVLRDTMFMPGDEVFAGNAALGRSIAPHIPPYVKVTVHDEHTDLMYESGITAQFLKSLEPRAELENGAYLVIEQTEALTVIDVNTGKFTGEDSLEQTVYCTNVLAAREIARQVHLRNLGGQFVVDFIDMNDPAHREKIVAELERALRQDGVRCKVLPMSAFGLVEFTRKRMGVAASSIMLKDCGACRHSGKVRTHLSILTEIRAKLLELLSKGATTVCADMNTDVCASLTADENIRDNIAALYPQARVYLVPHRTFAEDEVRLRAITSPVVTLPEGNLLLY